MTGWLAELVASARERARALPARDEPAPAPRPSFAAALRGRERLSVIAEYKRASPSLGAIARPDLKRQIGLYVAAGASAVSVLTEPTRFRGDVSDLEEAAAAVAAPLLMKDFVVHEAQVREARYRGASGVLLIVRCLEGSELRELAACALEHELTPLIECHAPDELERALAVEGAVIGINNRDLDNLDVDIGRAARLVREVPGDRIVVAESGYESASDLEGVRGFADAVLVGSALMRAEDPGRFIGEIVA